MFPVRTRDYVYINTSNNVTAAVKPKPSFRPVFQMAASHQDPNMFSISETLEGSFLFTIGSGILRKISLAFYQAIALC
jgi:hypothetical protein